MVTRRIFPRTSSPALMGSMYYWFYWSFIAIYDPFLNVYLAQLGLSGLHLGLLATILPILMLLYSPVVSALADRRGRRLRFLQFLLASWSIVLLLFAVPRTFWGVLPLFITLAVARTPTMPIGDSVIARMSGKHQLNYGSLRLWGSIGFAAFSILSGIVWQQTGFAPMFGVAAVAAVPCILITARLEEGPISLDTAHPSMRYLLQDKGLVILLIIAFLAGIPIVDTYIFGSIAMRNIGGSEMHMGLMFGLAALAEAPMMFASDIVMRRLHGPRTLSLSLLIMGLALVGHALAIAPWMLVMASVGKGIGYGLFIITLVRLVDERAGIWASTAQSMMNAALVGLAPLLTSSISGYVFDQWGGSVLFAGCSIPLFAGVLILAWVQQRGWLSQIR